MFFVFGQCPLLLRWKNVLSVSHPLHLRFSRNKSVSPPVITVNRPFLYGTYLVNVRFPCYISGIHAVIAWLLCPIYQSREPRAAEEKNFVTG